MIDIESDGPRPGDYTLIALGAVVVTADDARGNAEAFMRMKDELGLKVKKN